MSIIKKSSVQKWKQIYRKLMDIADDNERDLRRALDYSLKIMK